MPIAALAIFRFGLQVEPDSSVVILLRNRFWRLFLRWFKARLRSLASCRVLEVTVVRTFGKLRARLTPCSPRSTLLYSDASAGRSTWTATCEALARAVEQLVFGGPAPNRARTYLRLNP